VNKISAFNLPLFSALRAAIILIIRFAIAVKKRGANAMYSKLMTKKLSGPYSVNS